MPMNFAGTVLASSLVLGSPSNTQSDSARFIEARRAEIMSGFRLRTATFSDIEARAELNSVARECRAANWDGQRARAVTSGAIAQALRFLNSLPLGTPSPSVGADPDGHFTFEWYSSPRRLVTVSVAPDGLLHYAALFGTSSQYGTEPLADEFSRVINELVQRVQST